MKVGIVTINGNENYGNVLQNYAVQEVLREFGTEPETIINVTSCGHYITDEKSVRKITPAYIKKYIFNQLNYKYNIKNTNQGIWRVLRFYKSNMEKIEHEKQRREEAFIGFKEKYILESSYILDINSPWTIDQVNEYSYYISGSDQVWNPTYPSTSSINFLQFAPEKKRIALSPSFGINNIPRELQGQYAQWLEKIPYLSVREEQGKRIIKELCGREAKVLCDPTMAISREKWTLIEEKPSFLGNKKYILTYFLGDKNRKYDSFIREISRNYDLEIINLFDVMDIRAYATSPQEFIYLIHHAKLVCTDSFHGAVFSIIMNSNFITFPRIESGNSMESRIQTLLSTFQLQQRDYRKVNKNSIFNTDFSQAEIILQECRKDMITFLSNSIKVEKQKENKIEVQTIFNSKRKCCGCGACEMACPKNCIVMQEDEEGFLYPQINNALCIHCKRCEKVCPIKSEISKDKSEIECYAAYSLDKEIRKKSSSGGIFTELAKHVFSLEGCVYGAGFLDNFDVKHQEVFLEKELDSLRGSKYVQSELGSVYRQIKEKLEKNILVYFSGTPCQVKGLYSYLGKRYENLITQDIICHGVPSPLVWREYIKRHSNVKSVSFRDKRFGWHYFSLKIKEKKGTYQKRLDEDFYLKLFLDNTILRPSCYECIIKKKGSYADITLADCWNPENICNEINDTDEGLSMILINTEYGKKVWNQIKESRKIRFEKLDVNKAMTSQSALYQSAPCNPRRAVFFQEICQKNFEELVKEWYKNSFMHTLRIKITYIKTKICFWIKRRRENYKNGD